MSGHNRRLRDRLLARLVIAAILSGMLAAAGGVFLVNRGTRSALVEEILARNALLADELATRMDLRIENALDSLELVATRERVLGLTPAAQQALQGVLNHSSLYDELVLYRADGSPVTGAASQRLLDPASLRPAPDVNDWVDESNGVRVEPGFPPRLRFAVSVDDPPGQRRGVLVAVTSIEVVGAHIARIGGPSGIVPMLVGPAGEFLIHPERDRVAAGEVVPSALTRLLAAPESAEARIGGVPTLVAVAPLRLLSGAVVMTQPRAVALAPATQTTLALAAIIVFAIAAAVVAVLLVGRWLLSPLPPLAAAVARLGAGERGVRVAEGTPAEIGVVSREFNRMAAALDQRDEEVAQLQRLSLLVHAHADRDTLIEDLTGGALALLAADGCALALRSGGATSVVAWRGLQRPDQLETIAQEATRAGTVHRPSGAGELLALAVPGLQGSPEGAIVGVRWAGGFTGRERELGEAVAAIAGVALAQVRRLELERTVVEELQEAVDRRRALIGGITHEFRTPLTCIEGFSSALLERWDRYDDPQRLELIGKVHAHGRDLDALVSRLLDFAVIERGTVSGSMQPVVLDASIDKAIEGLGSIVGDRVISRDIGPVHVVADPTLLVRTLNNLLSNAVKYSSSSSGVTVRATTQGEEVRIDVRDYGIGMTPSEAERAFEPFWRAGHPEMRSVRGLGLGLSLVAEYVRAMEGRIRVTSEPGQGSTFSVMLRAVDTVSE